MSSAFQVNLRRNCSLQPVTTAVSRRTTKVLVAIANYGTKNRRFLDLLLSEYRSMRRHNVDIVVLSDTPKELGPDVEVMVGLPIDDPWSLPFAHKDLFALRSDNYDLFIYTEDDTLMREHNIEAFVEETRILPDDCIAGFMRYELDADGKKYYSSMHSHYHWDACSVRQVGESIYAHYTNDHAACFILTRNQLRRAIDSGGFLLPPRTDGYDMLVTAATDPYTRCGMKKLIPISRFDDFCLHHLPNVYCGKLGLDADIGNLEINRLTSLLENGQVREMRPLFVPLTLGDGNRWNKNYYEARRDDVLHCVPQSVKQVLSVGCGCGTTESELVKRGANVTAVPLDVIIRVTAESKGITMLAPDFDLAAKHLVGKRFDCILILDILQQLPEPIAIMRLFGKLLAVGGVLVVSVPNGNYHRTIRHVLTTGFHAVNRGDSGHRTTRSRVVRWLHKVGFHRIDSCWVEGGRLEGMRRWVGGLADEFICRNLLLIARR